MISPVGVMNSLSFKAIYKKDEDKFSEAQKAIVKDIETRLNAAPKDFYDRTLPVRMEEDYNSNINLIPAPDKKNVYMTISTGDAKTPFGVFNLDNTSTIVDDLDYTFPIMGEPSTKNAPKGLSTIALVVGAFLITLFGAVKCANTEAAAKTAKSAEKIIEHVRTSSETAQKFVNIPTKLFK